LRIIIREPSGLRLRPPRAWIDGNPVLAELHIKYGLVCTARFGNGRLGSVARYCDGLARYHELPQINGYPFHPSEQDMISAADIKDQELPKTSIKPVYWNGTHPSVFEFRVEKERDHDFDAAGASV
jgi:hypothetical protein